MNPLEVKIHVRKLWESNIFNILEATELALRRTPAKLFVGINPKDMNIPCARECLKFISESKGITGVLSNDNVESSDVAINKACNTDWFWITKLLKISDDLISAQNKLPERNYNFDSVENILNKEDEFTALFKKIVAVEKTKN